MTIIDILCLTWSVCLLIYVFHVHKVCRDAQDDARYWYERYRLERMK